MPKKKNWVRHGGSDQKPLKKGDLVRVRISIGKYEYGRVKAGFGMSTSTIGGALFVKPAKGRRGSIKEQERWHRDNMHIERQTSRRKARKKK